MSALLTSGPGARALDLENPFVAEWHREVNLRLRVLMPSRLPDAVEGISTGRLSRSIGVTPSMASHVTRGIAYLNYEHARRLHAEHGVAVEFILAADKVQAVGSARELGRLIAAESYPFQAMMFKLYAGKFPPVIEASRDHTTAARAFVDQWRTRVNGTLARLFPSLPSASASGVSTRRLAEALNVSQAYAVMILNGPKHLSFSHASALARKIGLTAEHFLEADFVAQSFRSVEELEGAIEADAKPSLRALLFEIWVSAHDRPAASSRDCPGLGRGSAPQPREDRVLQTEH